MQIRVEFHRRRGPEQVSVRSLQFAQTELLLGRGSDCAVHLADLRMGLQHARLQLQGQQLILEALQEPAFQYQGQAQRRLVLDLNDSDLHTLRLGPYALRAGWDAEQDQACVQLELVDSPPQPSEARDEEQIFGTARKLFTRRQMAWLGLLLSLALFVYVPLQAHRAGPATEAPPMPKLVRWAEQQWNSGPISDAHGHFSQDCQSCHVQGFERVNDAACLDCHQGLVDHAAQPALEQSQLPTQQGAQWLAATARQMLDIPAGRCASCHTEHNGNQLTTMAEGFCSDCHQNLDQRLPSTDLKNAGAFPAEHPAFRPRFKQIASIGEPEWVRQPASTPEAHGVLFNHAQHLNDPEVARKLDTLPAPARAAWGDELDCQDCHALSGPEQEPAPIVMETHCADCHQLAVGRSDDGTLRDLPHGDPAQALAALEDAYLAQSWRQTRPGTAAEPPRPASRTVPAADSPWEQMLRAEKTQLLSADGLCGQCHPVEIWEQPQRSHWPQLPADYFAAARFPHAPHVLPGSQCVDCHAAEDADDATTVLMPTIEQCQDCHRGADQASTAPSGCQSCHGYHGHPEAAVMQPRRANQSGDNS